MKKRIFKMLGIVLASVLGLFGVIAGVLALTGKFKADPIYPSRLSFENNTLSVNYDVDNPNQLYTFTLNAQSDKAKQVNKKEVYINLNRQNLVAGKNLIIITNRSGDPLPAQQDGFYKINCNEPTYFKVNREAIEATYTANEYGYVTVHGEARRDGVVSVSTKEDLKINVDIMAKELKIFAEGYITTQATNGGTAVLLEAGSPLNLEFEVGPNNALSSYTGATKQVEIYCDHTDGTYTLITQNNCAEYNLTWVGGAGMKNTTYGRNIYSSGYQFLSEQDSITKSFAAAIYPSMDYTDEADINDVNTVYNNHISKIPNCRFTIDVQAKDVSSIELSNNANYTLNVDNTIDVANLVQMTGTGADSRLKEIAFGIADKDNSFRKINIEFVSEDGASVLARQNPQNYQITNLGGYAITIDDVRYTLNLDNRLTLKSSDGQKEYRPIVSVQADSTIYTSKLAAFVLKNGENYSLVTLSSGSYMDFYINSTDLTGNVYTTATKNEFDYEIEKSGESTFTFKPKSEIADTNIVLNMFVINSNGKIVLASNHCTINIGVVVGQPTKEVQNFSANISYGETGRAFNTADINTLFNLKNSTGSAYSYSTFALATLDTTSGLDVIDKSFSYQGNTYKLLGYNRDGQFVNEVRANANIISKDLTNTKIYLVLLKTNDDLSSYVNTHSTIEVNTVYLDRAISTSVNLNLQESDLIFNFSTEDPNYLIKENNDAKFVYHVYGGAQSNTLTITSNNNLILQDINALYDSQNLVSLLNEGGNTAVENNNFDVEYSSSGYTIKFADNIVPPSSTDYYRFALNVGGQIVCSTHVYFIPNTPEIIQLKMEGLAENAPINLAASEQTAVSDNFPYIQIYIGWDANQYTYQYKLVYNGAEYDITNPKLFFNSTAAKSDGFGFIANPYPTLDRNLSYVVKSGDEYLRLNLDGDNPFEVLGVTASQYAVISITCSNANPDSYDNAQVTFFMRVKIDEEEENSFETTADKNDNIIEQSTINLLNGGYFNYTHDSQQISIDGAVFSDLKDNTPFGEKYNIQILSPVLDASQAVTRATDGQLVAQITDDANHVILKIEYKQVGDKYDLVFTREYNKNTLLYISFNIKVKTDFTPIAISLRFSPTLQVNRNSEWNMGFYADTTVLLYEVYNDDIGMNESKNKPVFKILNKNKDGAKIVVEVTNPSSSTTTVESAGSEDINAEYQFKAVGEYKFKFYTQADGAEKTPIIEEEYTITVKENLVVVLNDSYQTNAIDLQSDTNYTLSNYISLRAYTTNNNIVYGKQVDNKVNMYSDSGLLQVQDLSAQLNNLTFTSTDINISGGKINVGWIAELNFDDEINLTLNYNDTPIVIWGYDEVKNLVVIDSIAAHVTNKYKVTTKQSAINTYQEYDFNTLFDLANGGLNLKINSVQLSSNANTDIKFAVTDGKVSVSVANANLPEYTVNAIFTFVDANDEEKILTGEFSFTIKPYKPAQVADELTVAKDANVDILNLAYGIEAGKQVAENDTCISKIVLTQITINNNPTNITGEIGYSVVESSWQVLNSNLIDLSLYTADINTDSVQANITIQIVYTDGYTYTYDLTITITNNVNIQINYPINVSDVVNEENPRLFYLENEHQNIVFDNYEVVTLQEHMVDGAMSTTTTIDLAYDSLLNFSRVSVNRAENGVVNTYRLPADATISLYAQYIGQNSSYGLNNGITINGTSISFSVPNIINETQMYFVFKIQYQDAQAKFYLIKTACIDRTKIENTYYQTTKNAFVNYSDEQFVNVGQEVDILGKSVKTQLDSLFFSQPNYTADNIKLFYLDANYLGEKSIDGLINIKRGGLLNSNATLSAPADHLTLKIIVVYSDNESIFAPIGLLNVYITPTNSEVIDDNLLQNVSEGITGEYMANLTELGENTIFKDGDYSETQFVVGNLPDGFTLGEDGTITYKGKTILTLTNDTVKLENFADDKLTFTVTYTLYSGLTVKVNYTLNAMSIYERGSERLGDKFVDGKFNNYLDLSKYIPQNYNGKLTFSYNGSTSQQIDYKGQDVTGTLLENENRVKYGYENGTLVLYFIQDNQQYTLENFIINIDNLAADITSINLTIIVESEVNITSNGEGTNKDNAHRLTNINYTEDRKVNYYEAKGSSIYVEKTTVDNTELVQYKIYDGNDNSGTLLVTITTNRSAKFKINFRNSSDLTVATDIDKMIVLNNNEGSVTIDESTEISFAHLAVAYTIVMDLDVENYRQINDGRNRYYLTLPNTYNGLTAVYEVVNTTSEVVKPNDSYSVEELFTQQSAVNDILTDTDNVIINKFKFKVKDLNGQDVSDYSPSDMGFTITESVNHIRINEYDRLGYISVSDDHSRLTINNVTNSQNSSVLLTNYAGVSCQYSFNILPNGNGLDKADGGNQIFEDDSERYTTHFISDTETTSMQEKALTLGKIRSGDNTNIYITKISITEGNSQPLTADGLTIEKGVISSNNYTYRIFVKSNIVKLAITRTSGNLTSRLIVNFTLYGNSKIEDNFSVYIYNATETESGQKQYFGVDNNTIDLSKIYMYTSNVSDPLDLTWDIVKEQSSATIEPTNRNISLDNLFTQANNILTLKNQVQNINVTLKINIVNKLKLQDKDVQKIIAEKSFGFTIKMGISLYLHKDNEYLNFDSKANELKSQPLVCKFNTLPYTWNLASIINVNGHSYNIVAKTADGSKEVPLTSVISNVTCSNISDLEFNNNNGSKIIFNSDINDSQIYYLEFTLIGNGTTITQTLPVKFEGVVQVSYANGGEDRSSIMDNDQKGYNSGAVIYPFKSENTGLGTTAIVVTVADGFTAQVKYRYNIVLSSQFYNNAKASNWFDGPIGEDTPDINIKNLNEALTLPTTSHVEQVIVIYQFQIVYKKQSGSESENYQSECYYGMYQVNGINYVDKLADNKEIDVDKDNYILTEDSNSLLSLIYFEQTFTVDGDLGTFGEISFKLKQGDDGLVCVLIKGENEYKYTYVNQEWCFVNGEDKIYINFENNLVTYNGQTGQLTGKTTKSNLDTVNTLFVLKDDINMIDYLAFANDLINNGSVKFANPVGGSNIPESFKITSKDVEGDIVLCCNLTENLGDGEHLFNNSLTADIQLVLAGNNLAPANSRITLYTTSGVQLLSGAETYTLSDIIGSAQAGQDANNPILGVGSTSSIESNATSWVQNATSAKLSQNPKTYTYGNKTIKVYELTLSAGDSVNSKLYSSDMVTYVIGLDSGEQLNLVPSTHTYIYTGTSADAESEIMIEVLDCSTIFTVWSMKENKLTNENKKAGFEISYTSTDISAEYISTTSAGSIKVKASAMYNWFKNNINAQSVTLTFNVDGEQISITINKASN